MRLVISRAIIFIPDNHNCSFQFIPIVQKLNKTVSINIYWYKNEMDLREIMFLAPYHTIHSLRIKCSIHPLRESQNINLGPPQNLSPPQDYFHAILLHE